MFRHVVRRDAQSFRNLTNVERFVDQQAHDPEPGVLAEGPECHHAVLALNNETCAVTGGKMIEPNGLIRLARLCHWKSGHKMAQTVVGSKPTERIPRSMRAARGRALGGESHGARSTRSRSCGCRRARAGDLRRRLAGWTAWHWLGCQTGRARRSWTPG